MAQLVIEYDARSSVSRRMLQRLVDSKRFKISDVKSVTLSEDKINAIDEALEEVKMGRTSTYADFDEYKKEMRKIVGYV